MFSIFKHFFHLKIVFIDVMDLLLRLRTKKNNPNFSLLQIEGELALCDYQRRQIERINCPTDGMLLVYLGREPRGCGSRWLRGTRWKETVREREREQGRERERACVCVCSTCFCTLLEDNPHLISYYPSTYLILRWMYQADVREERR